MSNWIEITPKQAEIAIDAGVEFHIRGNGRENKFGGAAGHVDGEQALMAYCVFRGIPYEKRLTSFRGADIGERTQIRSTRHYNGRLVLHEGRDNPDHFYVLVRQHTKFEIAGWVKCSDGMKAATLEDHGYPALYVPNNVLRGFE